MGSTLKVNNFEDYDAGFINVKNTLKVGSGMTADSVSLQVVGTDTLVDFSDAKSLDFSATSVTFTNDAITGNAISGGSADCSLSLAGAIKAAPVAAGLDVTGTMNATTAVKVNSKSVLSYNLMAWGCFKVTVTTLSGAVTLDTATFGERLAGSSSNFLLGSSGEPCA